jgi:hypothetical protein
VLHLAIHYSVQAELATYVDEAYRRVIGEGLVEPLVDQVVEASGKDG